MKFPRSESQTPVHTLDLNFLGVPGTIAAYLIPHRYGAILIESGPGSTVPALVNALQSLGYAPGDVTDVLLTHIHLDHAGAAGWLAEQGARIFVHPVGAPHLLNPEKLLASARRIYGDMMEPLWGEFLPVPENRLVVISDGDVVEIDGLALRALDTPGHANHHFAYLFDDMCFSGDIGGVRMAGPRHLRLPMPPPELHLELWRASLEKLKREQFSLIAPTHFGIYPDASYHLAALDTALQEVADWMEATLPTGLGTEHLNQAFQDWILRRSLSDGLDQELIHRYETANPTWMSTQGILRYWQKNRNGDAR
ncbi:MAG TPA: MBL fold metallo-hydrolase [Anaerolineales bacterium]|nr:MBL fold metallo-hydrolase [Anaerolineales bacterium]